MLAETADSVAEAFEAAGGSLALEYKLDGARVQIHKNGKQVRIFSRNLNEVTESLPEVAEQVRHHLQARQAILDGEVIAVDAEGRPRPFQEVLRRFRRVHEIDELTADQPVRLSLFDVLYRDGKRLLDRPYAVRWKVLEQIGGPISRVARCVPASVAEGDAFARQAREAGHEGVMAKRLDSPYTPGVRGKLWFKIKHALTLDLVIVAADWGYGRRHGWLSNYHLAARDEETGEFWEVGKTFKGLTDAEFAEMTARLQKLKRKESRSTVTVRPEVVVEVTFNELQRSRAYPSGMALRFARIARLRPDKRADQADTIQTLRVLFERQFQTKARAAQSLDSR
jgi:DNA ligase-1